MAQGIQHTACILFAHIEECIIREKVDTPYLRFVAGNILIYELHKIAGEETGSLAYIHHQTFISAFGSATVLILAGIPFATLPFLAVVAVAVFSTRIKIDIRHIAVISQETVEFKGEHSLEKVGFRQPFEFLAHSRKIFCNLLLIHLYFLKSVGKVIELLFYDMLGGRHFHIFEGLSDPLLYLAELTFLAGMDDSHGNTGLVGTTRTTASVGVGGRIIRQTVVDHMGKIVNVETTRSHIGGYEKLSDMVAEFLHRQITLALREVAVQTVGIIAVVDKFVGNLLSLFLGAAEDDTVYIRAVIDNSFEGKIFIVGLHHIIYMAHIL